jgi:hypothetical protein
VEPVLTGSSFRRVREARGPGQRDLYTKLQSDLDSGLE